MCKYLVVGGGIAGVTCAETLAFLEPQSQIVLLSESSLIKTVTNLHAITKTIIAFDVQEAQSKILMEKYQNVQVVHDGLQTVIDKESKILTKLSKTIEYQYLCLCMGGEPKIISQKSEFPNLILGIRDTDSVETFLERLKSCQTILVLGNGGIASEIVYKAKNVEIHWVVKDNHISSTFVDPGAAEFFQDSLKSSNVSIEDKVVKRMRYEEDSCCSGGAALGPDWYKHLMISGNGSKSINVHYKTEILDIKKLSENTLEVTLSNQEVIECNLIISATGVRPNKYFNLPTLLYGSEGILVDDQMQTNLPNIYAAGDICQPSWTLAKHWFPMKLWTQARQMGAYAAKCMSAHSNNEPILQDFCFEIFTHSTKLFGYKVILLGLYNGQKLNNKYEILVRTTKNMEYIKFVLENHKLQGAVLIGDTDLEEMVENLILNQIDLEQYGDDILNPDIDIEDYFD